MRKLFVITALLLFAGITFSQPLQKGNLLGIHVITVTLEPDVTMDQFLKFYSEKYIPELEKTFEDWKLFVMKGIRGEHKNSIGLLFQIKDEATRNLYNNDDGTSTELAKKMFEELEPVYNELKELGTWTFSYTDWILQ